MKSIILAGFIATCTVTFAQASDDVAESSQGMRRAPALGWAWNYFTSSCCADKKKGKVRKHEGAAVTKTQAHQQDNKLKEEVARLKGQLCAVKATERAQAGKILALNGNVQWLQENVKTITSQRDSFDSQASERIGLINELTTQVSSLNSSIKTIKSQKASLERDKLELEQRNLKLIYTLGIHEDHQKEKDQMIRDLRSEVKKLKALEDRIVGLQGDLNLARANGTCKDRRMAEMRATLEKLEKEKRQVSCGEQQTLPEKERLELIEKDKRIQSLEASLSEMNSQWSEAANEYLALRRTYREAASELEQLRALVNGGDAIPLMVAGEAFPMNLGEAIKWAQRGIYQLVILPRRAEVISKESSAEEKAE